MNGTGIKGGAFGFKVSSINKVSSRVNADLLFAHQHHTAGRHQVSSQYDTPALLGTHCVKAFPRHGGLP
jgi:hypothetical protein